MVLVAITRFEFDALPAGGTILIDTVRFTVSLFVMLAFVTSARQLVAVYCVV
jgi:hypothetical protein